MKREIFTSFLIVVLFNFLAGCSTSQVVRVPPSQVEQSDDIDEAVLHNLSIIKFNNEGGRFVIQPSSVKGKLTDGRFFNIPVEQLREIRTSTVEPVNLSDIDSQKIVEIHLKNNQALIPNPGGAYYDKDKGVITGKRADDNVIFNIRIEDVSEVFTERSDILHLTDKTDTEGIIVKDAIPLYTDQLFTFDENGGRITEPQSVITGMTEYNERVLVNADSVLYVNVNKVDYLGVFFNIVGVGILIAGVLFLIALATMDISIFTPKIGN